MKTIKNKFIGCIIGLAIIKLAVRYCSEFQEVLLFVAFFKFVDFVIIFLSVILFFIIFWISVIESYFFAVLYKEKESFKTILILNGHL